MSVTLWICFIWSLLLTPFWVGCWKFLSQNCGPPLANPRFHAVSLISDSSEASRFLGSEVWHSRVFHIGRELGSSVGTTQVQSLWPARVAFSVCSAAVALWRLDRWGTVGAGEAQGSHTIVLSLLVYVIFPLEGGFWVIFNLPKLLIIFSIVWYEPFFPSCVKTWTSWEVGIEVSRGSRTPNSSCFGAEAAHSLIKEKGPGKMPRCTFSSRGNADGFECLYSGTFKGLDSALCCSRIGVTILWLSGKEPHLEGASKLGWGPHLQDIRKWKTVPVRLMELLFLLISRDYY